MTNFQGQSSSSRLHWLTPERALFFIPVLTSVGVAVALLSLVVLPMLRMVRERQAVVKDLSNKVLELPELVRDLQKQQAQKLQFEEQEKRLFKMLAGTKDLDTFLAGFNLLAVKHQVTVATTEPGAIESWVPPLDGESMEDDDMDFDGNLPNSNDSLLQEGLEKRSALIVVQGPFRNVQAFLQDLESLEVFVIASDLSMEAIRQSANETGNEALVQTKLELQLSAYGRVVTPIINDIDVMSEVSQ